MPGGASYLAVDEYGGGRQSVSKTLIRGLSVSELWLLGQVSKELLETRGTAAYGHTSSFFSSRGAAAPGSPRSGGRGTHFLVHFLFVFEFMTFGGWICKPISCTLFFLLFGSPYSEHCSVVVDHVFAHCFC